MPLALLAGRLLAAVLIFAPMSPSAAPLNYAESANWVCRPGSDTACEGNQTVAAISADGTVTDEPSTSPPVSEIDCFYVYPTVSEAATPSAPIGVTEAERRAVRQQAERFASNCRLFVPFYRQLTSASMVQPSRWTAEALQAAGDLALEDVIAAWDSYVAQDNDGRGYVLIGHSQGAAMIIALIQRRIEGQPIASRLVSVVIPGSLVLAPLGAETGGTLQSIPPCRSEQQLGCVITFNAVRASRPIPADRALTFPRRQAICTNPAALAGGKGELKAQLSTQGETILPALTAVQPAWTTSGVAIERPFVSLPGMLWGECKSEEHGVYLAVTVEPDDLDLRPGEFVGDWIVEGAADPTMGLHLIDLNLAAGNLEHIIRSQARAYVLRSVR